MSAMHRLVLTLVIVSSLLLACGGGSFEEERAVAIEFARALRNQDTTLLRSLVSPEEQSAALGFLPDPGDWRLRYVSPIEARVRYATEQQVDFLIPADTTLGEDAGVVVGVARGAGEPRVRIFQLLPH